MKKKTLISKDRAKIAQAIIEKDTKFRLTCTL